jgi:uncharacterized iron-regulated protein
MKVHEQSGNDFASHSHLAGSRPLCRRRLLGTAVLAALSLTLPSVTGLAGARKDDMPGKAGEQDLGPWKSPLLRDHPLVGRILDAASLAPMRMETLLRRAAQADVLVIGETHDNPDHHRIQAKLLTAYARARRRMKGRPPAIVFEMIDTDRDKAITALNRKPSRSADEIFDAARWEDSGWPGRDIYRPVMQAAAQSGGPVIAAGLPRRTVREVGRGGLEVLPEERRRALRLQPLSPAQQEGLEKQIVRSHCDMIPRSAAAAMSGVQRLRDALLAERVLQGVRRQGSAVLITGTGHARADRGAPLYLRRHDPRLRIFVVWLAEAREDARHLADLLPEDADPARVADAFIITPRARRDDPCEEFRRFMERRKRKKSQKDHKKTAPGPETRSETEARP